MSDLGLRESLEETDIRPLIDVKPPSAAAILVGAPRRRTPPATYAEEHLEELARLADTAGAAVVGIIIQPVSSSNPRSYISSGKLGELRELVKETEATLVVFDEELTPARGKNLERALARSMMDRSELTLDILASRAET